ncbi:MAG: alpha/beta-type small acid-soluble spore protein [Sedimentibacter sp.]|uniref:alpha/beta-type small acid-soluble spore protein n=1 Tax=Sedimentibacter sp. TaxID=1960295 RepID=UPI0031590C1F
MASNNNNSGSNNIVVPEAKQALNQMKAEIASELGLTNYEQVDKGNLTARQNGYVGGYMTKRLVEMAQRQMSGTSGMGSSGMQTK